MKQLPCFAMLVGLVACHHPTTWPGGGIVGPGNNSNTTTDTTPPAGNAPNPNSGAVGPLTGSACKAFTPPGTGNSNITLTPVFSGLTPSYPVGMQQPPGDSSRWYMIEQSGRVSVFPNDPNATEAQRLTALDLTHTIYNTNEAGLLGLVFDPNFASNKTVYLVYTLPQSTDPNSTAVYEQLVQYTLSSDGNSLNPNGVVILSQNDYFDYHLGGNIAFGNDGLLYMGVGFNDTANDPAAFAQNNNDWRGKMLRIDVHNVPASATYGIPSDNPFANGGGAPEIYAVGLRNPWRWSFDTVTGTLWLGDVGQDLYEEVDIIQKGNNYGWPIYEGTTLNPNGPGAAPGVTYTPPVWVFGHSDDICITGGYVYRGRNVPNLVGKYVFGDCLAGHIYALDQNATSGAYEATLLINAPSGILSFAQDNSGELYALTRTGAVFRLDAAATTNPDANLPQLLSQTGCTDSNDITLPAAATLTYNVRVPFWSDGADKGRYVALPSGGTLAIDANNHLTLPSGTVLVKTFGKANKRVETRLFMRFNDGTWGGFSYRWNDAQTDAALVPAAGDTETLADGTVWNFPSRAQCLTCHSAAPGFTLGWQVSQLNTPIKFTDGTVSNQLQAFVQYGLLAAPSTPIANLPQLTDPNDTTASLEDHARTYLHVNCSVCHQPGGMGLGPADFRITQPTSQLGVCNVAPTYGSFGLTNPHLLTPGSASNSVMSYRMHATGLERMPAISSHVVDPVGTAAIDNWINAMTSCP